MEIRLVIKETNEEDYRNPVDKEYTFSGDSDIQLGRSNSNDVVLIDKQRTVSRKHARIIYTHEGFCLEDQGSTNATYLNDVKLGAKEKVPVSNGDKIKVGDFIIEVIIVEESIDKTTYLPPDKGVPDYSKDNPFTEDVKELNQLLAEIIDKYNQHTSSSEENTDSYLSYALENNMDQEVLDHPIISLLQKILGNVPENSELESFLNTDLNDSAVLDFTIGLLIEAIRIPHEFRNDFLGNKLLMDDSDKLIYEGKKKDIKKALLEEKGKDKEVLDKLQGAIKKLHTHQEGMVEGYMSIVKSGIDVFTMKMNLQEIEEEVLKKNRLLASVSNKRKYKAIIDEIKVRTKNVDPENWVSLEKTLYRPVFTRSYIEYCQNDKEDSDK